MKNLLFVIALTLWIVPATGQHHQMDQKREQIQAYKIAYITNELQLTPDEAEKFWPIYNEFELKRKDMEKDMFGDYHQGGPDISTMSDEEIDKLVMAQLEKEKKLADLRYEYYLKLKKVLPIRKVFLLQRAEMEFKRVLLDRIREGEGKWGPPPK